MSASSLCGGGGPRKDRSGVGQGREGGPAGRLHNQAAPWVLGSAPLRASGDSIGHMCPRTGDCQSVQGGRWGPGSAGCAGVLCLLQSLAPCWQPSPRPSCSLCSCSPGLPQPPGGPPSRALGLHGVISPGSGWAPCSVRVCIRRTWRVVDARVIDAWGP